MRLDALESSPTTPLLVPIAVACAGGIGVAVHLPPLPVWAWVSVMVGASVIAVALALRGWLRLAPVALAIGAFSLGGLRLTQVAHALPPDHLGRMVEASGDGGVLLRVEAIAMERPVRLPRRGALAEYDHRPPRWRFRAELVAVLQRGTGGQMERIPATGTVRVSVADTDGRPPTVNAGDRFVVAGRLRPPAPPRNPGEPDARRYARLAGIVGTFTADGAAIRPVDRAPGAAQSLWRLRGAFRAHGDAVLQHALPRSLGDEPRGLIRAMLLGERQEGLDDLEPAFRRTGLAHLLAISGFHLAVLAGAAAMLTRGRSMNVRRAAMGVAAGVIPYLLMVEAQPSVMRAGAMLLAVAAATSFGRGWSAGGVLSLALLAILVPWPGDLARPGFQLSFAVVAGLVWIAPRVRERWFAPVDRHASSFLEFAIERSRAAAAIAVTAWLVSTPLILFHFGMASPLAAPLSIVAIPLAAVLLVCGHLTLAITPLVGELCHVLGWVVALLAELLIAFVRHADTLPGIAVFRPAPGPLWLTLAMTAVAALALAPRSMPTPRDRPRRPLPPTLERARRALLRCHDLGATPLRRFGVPAATIAVLGWPLLPPTPPAPDIALRIDMLAVGDGTCIVLRLRQATVLYDAGSTDLSIGGRTLVPALRSLGIRRIDAILVSHADADHYSGVPEIVEAFDVGEVVVTDDFLRRVRARPGPVRRTHSSVARRGIPIGVVAAGHRRTVDSATLTWLHPPLDWPAALSNDHSQVIAVEVAGRTLLLTGDIEDLAVEALRRAQPGLRADIVELPHHGSWRRPAAELIVALEPTVILQSTGPRRLELDRWAPLLADRLPETTRLVTARDGAVWAEIRIDGSMRVGHRHEEVAIGDAPTARVGERYDAALHAASDRSPRIRPPVSAYVHTLDPVLLPIYGNFAIRWYGLAYVAGFVVGWLVLRWMARSGRSPLTTAQLGDFVTAIVIGVLVGGRVGHAILYEPSLLWTFSGELPFWNLLAVHKGGMSSHGGIAGVVLACVWTARRTGNSTWHLLDLAAFAAPTGLSLGRVANFINGELWGRPLPESMRADPPWWSVKYPEEVLKPGFADAHAAQLEAMRLLVDPSRPFPHSLVDAAYAGHAAVIERLSPLLTPHWPSQIFQAITDGPLLMALLVIVWWKPRRAGVVASWFVIGYGTMRLATEQFRAPDEGVLWFGPLTLPMVLSVLMIVVGALMVFLNATRPGVPLGGLRTRGNSRPTGGTPTRTESDG